MSNEVATGVEVTPVLVQAQGLVITTHEQVSYANETRKAIKELKAKVVAAFGEPKKKAHETWKLLVTKESEHLKPLDEAYDLIGKKIGEFLSLEEKREKEERRKLEEEAAKAQAAELARIEKKTAALLEKAGGLNEQIMVLATNIDDPSTTEEEAVVMRKQLAALVAQRDKAEASVAAQQAKAREAAVTPIIPAASTPAPKVAGLSTREKKTGIVCDKGALIGAVAAGTLPQDLLDINPSVLNKLVNAGMVLPGVQVNIEKIVATRG